MQKLHDQIKRQLQDNNQKYKRKIDHRRREVNFEIGNQVLAHIRKEIFPKGNYNNLKVKNIIPCKILRNFVPNAYEIELPENVGISQIFNVVDLYPYRMNDTKWIDGREDIQ